VLFSADYNTTAEISSSVLSGIRM